MARRLIDDCLLFIVKRLILARTIRESVVVVKRD